MSHSVQRLGKNKNAYVGETIDIRQVLRDDLEAARKFGWQIEELPVTPGLDLLAFRRDADASRIPDVPGSSTAEGGLRGMDHAPRKIYISTGIHGDEPAGPLAIRQLLLEDHWPADADVWLLPCLNPTGFPLNRRENAKGVDLNRDYRRLQTDEIRAHVAWLEKQPRFDLALCVHEDWESHGFYVYELNPDHRPSLAEKMIAEVAKVCPIDPSEVIEDRPAKGGIIRPDLDPTKRPQWPEAFYLITNKTRQSYTLESPSDFPLSMRVAALVAGVRVALEAGE
jgi:succinylglutamate desuccinylase/aspartoacylase family protein